MKKAVALLLALLMIAAAIISCTDNDLQGDGPKDSPVSSENKAPEENDDNIPDGSTAGESLPDATQEETQGGNPGVIELPRDEF